MMIQGPDVLTVKDVAKYLRVTDKTVRNLIGRNELEFFRVGSKIRVTKEALIDYLNRER